MDGMELSVDEFTGRGLEQIRDPTELAHSLQTVIAATPETVPKTKVVIAACLVPRFQKTPKRKTQVIAGANIIGILLTATKMLANLPQ